MKRSIVLSILFFAICDSEAQSAYQLKLLNQLDQLDKLDLQDTLEAANACADREDFSCAEIKIKEAKLLVVDNEDAKAIAQAQSYVSEKITARDQRIAEQRRQASARSDNAAVALLNYLGNVWQAWKSQGSSSSSSSSYSSSNSTAVCRVNSVRENARSGSNFEIRIEYSDRGGNRSTSMYVSPSSSDSSFPYGSHYKFSFSGSLMNISPSTKAIWFPSENKVYVESWSGWKSLSGSANSMGSAVKIYFESTDSPYCPS